MDFLTDLNHADWIGIVGSVVIAAAYFAVSTGRMVGTAPLFQYLNLGGSALILYSLWTRPNAGAIVIEVLWVAIALYSLVKYRRDNS